MKNLKKLRQAKKMSQQQLALKLNLSQQTIYKYENQITEPDITTLINLADYFNTSVDYLIGNTNNPQKPGKYIEEALSEDELEHIRLYRCMPEHIQGLINQLMAEFYSYKRP